MQLKCIFLLLLLAYSQFIVAQDLSLDNQIQKIDSLLEYNHYDQAEIEADNLLSLFEKKYNNKKYLEQKLQLLLIKGRMYEVKEENTKALKILLEVADEAEKNKFYKIACHANIVITLIYEKREVPDLAKRYLDAADRIYKEHKIEELLSPILIRRSLYHRFFTKDQDSAMYYIKKALESAKEMNNELTFTEATLMTGIYEGKKGNYQEGINCFSTASKYYSKVNNFNGVVMMYINMSMYYLRLNQLEEAKALSDSSLVFFDKASKLYQVEVFEQRYKVFEAMNNIDSAYFYIKKHQKLKEEIIEEEEAATIKRITEQYNNDKKEITIKNKNLQLIFAISFLIVIAITTLLLIYKNRRINAQNKIINNQINELTKTIEQKQVLLYELQHRVKNNLQHVISVLEIQKESVNFNNIDELIRGNQNRIHSMALLHKKLNISENVNDIKLCRYINELSELVKDSYDSYKKKTQLNIKCEVDSVSIEKALPIGLIIVELVSNSMKHAFNKQNIGIINIEITKDKNTQIHRLYYSDNGSGFDFNAISEKGLGMEIVKGLIDQLDATVETSQNIGFELTLYFK